MANTSSNDHELPRTTESDRIGDLAVNECERILIRQGWKFRRQDGKNDFGIDAEAEIVEANRVTGKIFKLQIKGSESLAEEDEFHSVPIKRSTYNLWQAIPLPVIALLCDIPRGKTYWTVPLSQVPKPGAASMSLRFQVFQTLPETFHDLSVLLNTWFGAFTDNILFEVPHFYESFQGLKAQLGMDFGCELDGDSELELRLFYRHLVQLRLRLGLRCNHIPPLDFWYLRNAALTGRYSHLSCPTFDEMILYLEHDYTEAIDELRTRTENTEICFENQQVINFFRRLDGKPAVYVVRDTRLKDPNVWSKFEALLQQRGALKWKFDQLRK